MTQGKKSTSDLFSSALSPGQSDPTAVERESTPETETTADPVQASVGEPGGGRRLPHPSPARMRATLDHQIANGRFTFVLQPIVDARTNAIVMREALLRYRSKDGLLWPASFLVPQAERADAVDLIDCLALQTAARILKQGACAPVSINLSRRSLNSEAWLTQLGDLLAKQPDLAERLVIEVTETSKANDGVSLTAFIDSMRKLGLRIAIDDFGAGFTTWSDVEPSDVSYIKFDRGVVMRTAQQDSTIQTVLELVKDRNIKTIAEGIEDRETADRMSALGVDYLQGFLYGAPRAL